VLFKSSDDKSKRLALLEDLQRSQLVDPFQRKWLRDELMRLRKGIQGERDSAHYLDNYFKDRVNKVVMHDLRFEVDGEVAQIDHMIMNRAFGICLLETKNYAANLVINDHGEFTVKYEDARFGIPSPIEQSHRHERILSKLLEQLEIVGRTQKMPEFHHVVMLHPKAIIHRPPHKAFDTSNVIKADQFPTWHQKYIDQIGMGTVLKSALNMRSQETIKEWCEKLVCLHRPGDLLALPDFMRPKEKGKAVPAQSAPVAASKPFPVKKPEVKASIPMTVRQSAEEPAKRLICTKCRAKISFPEGKFCWNNAPRFGGLAYCRVHQALC
jgi:hypothetical protein